MIPVEEGKEDEESCALNLPSGILESIDDKRGEIENEFVLETKNDAENMNVTRCP